MNPKTRRMRLDKEALFSLLDYEPHEGQWQVHRSKAQRRVVACGTRWGKSTLAVYEAIAWLLEPRDRSLGWLVAPTYELTKRVFERVVVVLHQRMPRRVKFFDPRTHTIVVVNLGGGLSELRARSADRPAGLLGDAVDFIVVDECTEIREDTWDSYIAARLVDRHGKALLISTPTDVNSWFYKQFRRAKKDSEYASFAMPTASNPHIDADRIEAERKRLTPEDYACQYEAKFAGIDVDPCDTCKGPDRYVSCVVSLHGDEQPKLCPECGMLVGDDGLTRVALVDGKPHATIIRFVEPRDPEIVVPGGVSRVLTCEPTPENIELPGEVDYRLIEIHPPLENPEELPPGCE